MSDLRIDMWLDNLATASQDRRFLEDGVYRELVITNVVIPLIKELRKSYPSSPIEYDLIIKAMEEAI